MPQARGGRELVGGETCISNSDDRLAYLTLLEASWFMQAVGECFFRPRRLGLCVA